MQEDNSPWAAYQALIAGTQWQRDAAQAGVARVLDGLWQTLAVSASRRWAFWRPPVSPKGVYIYGDVGRGKSTLMDIFYKAVTVPKQRRHFHDFIEEMLATLHEERKQGRGRDPLSRIAARVAATTRVLCLDEFFINDITHAMIVKTVFAALFARGVVLVATSNIAPEHLYAGGLQREAFLPFIDLLQAHTQVVCLTGDRDYREGTGESHWLVPATLQTAQAQARIFQRLTHPNPAVSQTLTVQGRPFAIPRIAGGVAWFDFADLCARPVGVADYTALMRVAHTLFIVNIPRLDDSQADAARRFMHLIDVVYECGGQVYATAACPADDLCAIPVMREGFKRTASRIRVLAGGGGVL